MKILFLSLFLVDMSLIQAQNYVQITIDEVAIFAEPNATSDHIIRAQQGDVFIVESADSEWIHIRMVSDEIRYLKKNDSYISLEFFHDSNDTTIEIKLCEEIQLHQSRAQEEAILKWADDFERQIIYENFLFDKYMMDSLRKYNISTADQSLYVQCINDSLINLERL